MRVAGYVRVSTEDQAREGYSLAAQEEAIRLYAAAHRWDVSEVYVDAARSGKSTKGREALARLLQDADRHLFDRVIFWRLDRLGRNVRDLLEICDRLDARDVGIISIQESIDTSTPAGRMMRTVLGALAEFERETIVERIKMGIEQKAKEGELVGPVPLGYIRDEAGNLVHHDPSAGLVQQLFELYAEGRSSLRELAVWANAQGLRSTEGNAIDRFSVRKILTNAAYAGDVAYHKRRGGGVVARGTHLALVDRELFDRVQAQLTNRRRTVTPGTYGRTAYPLTGVAVCAGCRSGFVGNFQTGVQRRYLRCSTVARHGRHACSQPMVPAELIEAQVAAYVSTMRLPLEYITAVVEELRRRNHADDSEADRKRLTGQLDRLKRLFLMGDIDEARYRQDSAALKAQLERLEPAQILDIEQAVYYLRTAGSEWSHQDMTTQRAFVQEVFERVTVMGAQVTEIKPRPEYAPLFHVDREERFGQGRYVEWLPGLDSEQLNYIPVIDPRSGSLFAVPALVS